MGVDRRNLALSERIHVASRSLPSKRAVGGECRLVIIIVAVLPRSHWRPIGESLPLLLHPSRGKRLASKVGEERLVNVRRSVGLVREDHRAEEEEPERGVIQPRDRDVIKREGELALHFGRGHLASPEMVLESFRAGVGDGKGETRLTAEEAVHDPVPDLIGGPPPPREEDELPRTHRVDLDCEMLEKAEILRHVSNLGVLLLIAVVVFLSDCLRRESCGALVAVKPLRKKRLPPLTRKQRSNLQRVCQGHLQYSDSLQHFGGASVQDAVACQPTQRLGHELDGGGHEMEGRRGTLAGPYYGIQEGVREDVGEGKMPPHRFILTQDELHVDLQTSYDGRVAAG